MFEDLMKETVTLSYPTGQYSDGEPVYEEYSARAFVFDYHERLLKEIGMVENARFFVVESNERTQEIFAVLPLNVRVVCGSSSFDLKTVKACRGLDGMIECFSCAGV